LLLWRRAGPDYIPEMVRIAISSAAFEAIASTTPLGSIGFENERAPNGDYFVWLPREVLARLMRELRDSYSDAVLRVVEGLEARGGERSRAYLSKPRHSARPRGPKEG
jgi:hypothetical protein